MLNASYKGFDSPFASRLRNLIIEKKIKHADLAKLLSVTRQSVGQYCDGTSMPPLDKIVALADYFDVSTDYLLGRTDVKSTDSNIKMICEYTGLSEENIMNLHSKSYKPATRTLANNVISNTIYKRVLFLKIGEYLFYDALKTFINMNFNEYFSKKYNIPLEDISATYKFNETYKKIKPQIDNDEEYNKYISALKVLRSKIEICEYRISKYNPYETFFEEEDSYGYFLIDYFKKNADKYTLEKINNDTYFDFSDFWDEQVYSCIACKESCKELNKQFTILKQEATTNGKRNKKGK